MTKFGPLVKYYQLGYPINDLDWQDDTCHPKIRDNGKITCDALWEEQSQKGDYHDNMNSEMFMLWIYINYVYVVKGAGLKTLWPLPTSIFIYFNPMLIDH